MKNNEYMVGVRLMVKARTQEEANYWAQHELAGTLNEWMNHDPEAPFPNGTLLCWWVPGQQPVQ